ncbi:hypothetical protein M2306_000238 [Myroides gitamensis]|nr:hypothetical protein [Myroides odoratus]MDH6599544.1 hypothetical protein [Myroides gitamensis]
MINQSNIRIGFGILKILLLKYFVFNIILKDVLFLFLK